MIIARVVHGLGTGIIATSVLLYCMNLLLNLVREIVPKEMFNSISILFGFAIGFGHDLVYLMNLLNEHYKTSRFTLLFAFFIPGIISAFQLIIMKYQDILVEISYEHQEEDVCSSELSRIYLNSERQLAENKRIKEIIEESRYQYPSYSELLSTKYRSQTIKGVLAICLRCFAGGYSMSMFAAMIYENNANQVKANIITDTVNTIVSIVPFFYINCI
jgi:cell division protein FtsL